MKRATVYLKICFYPCVFCLCLPQYSQKEDRYEDEIAKLSGKLEEVRQGWLHYFVLYICS